MSHLYVVQHGMIMIILYRINSKYLLLLCFFFFFFSYIFALHPKLIVIFSNIFFSLTLSREENKEQ